LNGKEGNCNRAKRNSSCSVQKGTTGARKRNNSCSVQKKKKKEQQVREKEQQLFRSIQKKEGEKEQHVQKGQLRKKEQQLREKEQQLFHSKKGNNSCEKEQKEQQLFHSKRNNRRARKGTTVVPCEKGTTSS
jgi:hypothetical protein